MKSARTPHPFTSLAIGALAGVAVVFIAACGSSADGAQRQTPASIETSSTHV